MALILNIDMAIDSVNDLFTGNEVRGHSLALSMHKLRSPLISSSESNKEYHICVKRDSDRMDEDEPVSSTGNSQDEYTIQERKKGQVSKTADIKNIKESLCRMGNYIKDKSVNSNSNNIKNLDNVGKVVWEFLSTVYDTYWDSLYVDNSKMSFRNKVKSKFNSQALRTPVNNKGKETVKPTYVSPLSPPILAKTPKEVNEISKYFKKNDNLQKKSYTQASSKPQSSNAIMNTLKIKKIFLKLQNQKIDQVQKIINGGENKPKPRIYITTKGPSYKQIIIPMNKEAANKYIKDANNHISNINQALKVIKSSIITDFIHIDNRGIIISTNIWIDIWDTQNRSNTRKIINRYFNIESFIAMVCRANMNLDVPQCKNCWK